MTIVTVPCPQRKIHSTTATVDYSKIMVPLRGRIRVRVRFNVRFRVRYFGEAFTVDVGTKKRYCDARLLIYINGTMMLVMQTLYFLLT